MYTIGGEEILLKKSKKGLKLVLVCILLMLIAGTAVIAVTKYLKSGEEEYPKEFVYAKNGYLYYMENGENDEPIPIVELEDGNICYLKFTSDMRYVYFIDSSDVYDRYGTLYKFPLTKISKNEAKNKQKLKKIDTKVDSYHIEILVDNTIIYTKKNDKLYWCDEKDSVEIMEDVSDIYYFQSDKEFLCSTYEDSKEILYQVKLEKEEPEIIEVDENITGIGYSWETGMSPMFVYFKNSNGESGELYIISEDCKPEKIAEKVAYVRGYNSEEQKVY